MRASARLLGLGGSTTTKQTHAETHAHRRTKTGIIQRLHAGTPTRVPTETFPTLLTHTTYSRDSLFSGNIHHGFRKSRVKNTSNNTSMSLSHAIAPEADEDEEEEDEDDDDDDGRAFCLSLEGLFLAPTMSTRHPPPPPPPEGDAAPLPLPPSGSASGPEDANNDRPLCAARCVVHEVLRF